MRKLAFASLLIPALAVAQPKSADDYYKEGETQYNLGNFLPAVEAFKKGFELEPNESKKAAYLYNVAQSYRLAKDCGQAVFFYKRYLSLKENDQKKPLNPAKKVEIEGWIKELDDCAKSQEAVRQKQPDGPSRPDTDPPTSNNPPPGKDVADTSDVGDEGDDEEDPGSVTKTGSVERPRVISARVLGGGAKISAGSEIDIPVQATFAAILGYPLAVNDQFVLDLGAGFSFTPVPYTLNGMSKTATMTAAFINVGATYHVIPKLGLRVDAGVGGMFFGGVSDSQFTNYQETTGALSMLYVRAGVSADYAITPNLIATLAPFAFAYSPAKEGLADSIDTITAIDFMVGLGYRM